MKYKVGDIVRVKTREKVDEELQRVCGYESSRAALFGGLYCICAAFDNKGIIEPWYYFFGHDQTPMSEFYIEAVLR